MLIKQGVVPVLPSPLGWPWQRRRLQILNLPAAYKTSILPRSNSSLLLIAPQMSKYSDAPPGLSYILSRLHILNNPRSNNSEMLASSSRHSHGCTRVTGVLLISRNGWRTVKMHLELETEKSLGSGCVRHITPLMRSLERRSLIVGSGRKDGELGGKMGDVTSVRYWTKTW